MRSCFGCFSFCIRRTRQPGWFRVYFKGFLDSDGKIFKVAFMYIITLTSGIFLAHNSADKKKSHKSYFLSFFRFTKNSTATRGTFTSPSLPLLLTPVSSHNSNNNNPHPGWTLSTNFNKPRHRSLTLPGMPRRQPPPTKRDLLPPTSHPATTWSSTSHCTLPYPPVPSF